MQNTNKSTNTMYIFSLQNDVHIVHIFILLSTFKWNGMKNCTLEHITFTLILRKKKKKNTVKSKFFYTAVYHLIVVH